MPVLQGVAAASSPLPTHPYPNDGIAISADGPSRFNGIMMDSSRSMLQQSTSITSPMSSLPYQNQQQQQYYSSQGQQHPSQSSQYSQHPGGSQDPSQVASSSRLPASSSIHPAAQQQQQQQPPSMSNQRGLYEGAGMPINASAMRRQGEPSSSLRPGTALPTTAADLMREGPRDFTVIKAVGDGSFGTVCLADWKSPLPSGTMLSPMQHPTTRPEYIGKRLVAIKRMKKPFKSWNDCMKLKELKSLLDIPHHPNIIPLYDAFLDPSTKELHFVFECMEGNLYQLTKSRKGRPLAGGLVASIFKQIIDGLHHIHQHGYFHRDMKPENLLITTTGLDDYPASHPEAQPGAPPERDVIVIVKLADFGLARETNSSPPYTEYVSTRWYRAPEVLLRSRDYSNPVDMWALGTILAELVNLRPLFPGDSEVDQVLQVCDVLGDPSHDYGLDSRGRMRGGGPWERGQQMAASVGFTWPKAQPVKFSSLFTSRVPIELIDCIEDLLRYDPALRATTSDCLKHAYFSRIAPGLRPVKSRAPVVTATRPPSDSVSQHSIPPPLPAVDLSAARQALPPSHSHTPAGSRPAFGEGQQPLQRVPFFRPAQQVSNGAAHDLSPTSLQAPPMSVMSSQQSHSPYGHSPYQQSVPELHPDTVGHGSAQQQQQQHSPEQRRKGWGMTLSSVFHSSSSNHHQPTNGSGHAFGQSQDQNASGRPMGVEMSQTASTASRTQSSNDASNQPDSGCDASPDQSRVTLASSVQSHSDPKKAKKEAEKAARQAEKAKRVAQEKAARDRARAVMQKRNQIMASSDTREQVEWLNPGPSDKSRGKQAVIDSAGTGLPPAQSPMHPPLPGFSPEAQRTYPYLTAGPQASLHAMHSPGATQRPLFNSNDYRNANARPFSMQTHATGESDPGPRTHRQISGQHHHLAQRHPSVSSLSSGLDTLAHSSRYSHLGQSTDSFGQRSTTGISVVSSLDPQLVSNMEAMTAQEQAASGLPRRDSGSTSPAPLPRMTASRHSGKSRSRNGSISHQRAGSASPLHQVVPPRFHPYGLSNGVPPASSHSQQSSSTGHSHYSGFQLPSLHFLEDEPSAFRKRSSSYLQQQQGPTSSATTPGSGHPLRPGTIRRQSSSQSNQPLRSRSNSAAIINDSMSFSLNSPASHSVHLPGVHPNGSNAEGGPLPHSAGPTTGGLGIINPMWGSAPQPQSDMYHRPRGYSREGGPPPSSGGPRLPSFSTLVAGADLQEEAEQVDSEMQGG